MHMKTLRFLALLTLIFISAMKTKAQPAVAPLPARNYNFSITRKTQMQYLLYLPADYKPKGPHRWPLMLFLHGAGERGTLTI